MQMLTKPNLRICWCILIGVISLVSCFPGASLQRPLFGLNIDSGWAHFLVFAVAATIPLLAWMRRTALTLDLGIAILSVGLQLLRGFAANRPMDSAAMVINVLGIAAGILIGLNLGILRAHGTQPLS